MLTEAHIDARMSAVQIFEIAAPIKPIFQPAFFQLLLLQLPDEQRETSDRDWDHSGLGSASRMPWGLASLPGDQYLTL